jgi:hypothetical protein
MFLIKPRFNIILFLLLRDGCSTKNNSTPSFFSDAYWFGANAEFSFYRAPLWRKGTLRPADLMSILAREPFAPKHLGKADDPTQAGTCRVFDQNQISRVQTGIYLWRRMLSLLSFMFAPSCSIGRHRNDTVEVTVGYLANGIG